MFSWPALVAVQRHVKDEWCQVDESGFVLTVVIYCCFSGYRICMQTLKSGRKPKSQPEEFV